MKFQNIDTKERSGSYGGMTATTAKVDGNTTNVLKSKVPKRGKEAKMTLSQRKQQAVVATVMAAYDGMKKQYQFTFLRTKPYQSVPSLFLSKNEHVHVPLLTKEQAAEGTQLLTNYVVSDFDKRLGEIKVLTRNGKHIFGICLGSLAIGPQTTVLEFSNAVVSHGRNLFNYGDAITILDAVQLLPADGYPAQIEIAWDKVELTDQDDAQGRLLLSDVAPYGLFQSTQLTLNGRTANFLCLPDKDLEMVCPVWSRKLQDERTICSDQKFVGRNSYLDTFLKDNKEEDAVLSYGPVQRPNNYRPNRKLPTQDNKGFSLEEFMADQQGSGSAGSKPDSGNSGNPDPTPEEGEGQLPGSGEQQPGQGGEGQQPEQGGGSTPGSGEQQPGAGEVEITVAVNIPAGGEPFGSGFYAPGTQLQIGVNLKSTYHVLDWSDDTSCHSATRTITVPDHPQTYTVYIAEAGSGIGREAE